MARSRTLGYGEGSVYRDADGRWRGELRRGSRRTRVSGVTRREVTEKLDEIRAKMNAGIPLGSNMRVGELLAWYLHTVVAEKDVSTIANYEWAIRRLEYLHGRPLRDLDVDEVERLLAELSSNARPITPREGQERVGNRGGKPRALSKASLSRIKTALGAALHEAERRGLVARNVARLAHLPPGARPTRERRSLTREEAQHLLGNLRGTRDEALILTTLMLGLRPGEVTGLTWEALDLDSGKLEVRNALKRLPDETYVLGPPKVASYRALCMPTAVLVALRQHRLEQMKERLSAPVWENDLNLVFTNTVGRPIDASNLRRTIRFNALQAEIGHLSPNELRHSAASLLVSTGESLVEVADLLGHRDVRMLAQTYRHKVRPVVDLTAAQERMFG